MGDIALKGPELKKSIALAKKRDMNFAYCPGNDPAEDVFVLDRKKKPEVIGRVARGEGTGTKLGFGTAKVKGKVITLTCDRVLPQAAKKLKKFLKSEGIAMNVIVLDANGAVLEEDVEDLGPDEEEEEIEDTEDDVTEEASDDTDDGSAEDLKRLKARAAQLQPAIKELPSEKQAPVIKGFKKGVGEMQGGDLAAADATFTQVEAAINKLAGTDAKDTSAPTNPALDQLKTVSEKLAQRLDALGDAEGVSRLRAAHGVLDGQIADGDAKKAAGTAKALGDAIGRIAAAGAAAAAEDSAQAAPAENTENAPDLSVAFRDARADLEPVALELLNGNLGDVSKMRAVLAYFTEKGEAEDFAGAMKAVPGLKKLIADAQAAEQTAAEADIPEGVVPFVRARLDWVKTRVTLKSELTKLQSEILAVCSGDEFPTIANDSNTLFSYLETLDTRLENALEALVQEPDGTQREKLKAAARKVLEEYRGELDTPFFQAVDGKNGFKPVNVRGAALASLGKVTDALAA